MTAHKLFTGCVIVGVVLLTIVGLAAFIVAISGTPVSADGASGSSATTTPTSTPTSGPTTPSAAPSTSPKSSPPIPPPPPVVFDSSVFIVRTVTYNCYAEVKQAGGKVDKKYGLPAPVIGALMGQPPRTSGDAYAPPIVAKTPLAARAEVQRSICADPLLGVGVAHALAVWRPNGLDLTRGDIDPWLAPYASGDIATQAAEFLPLLDVDRATPAQIDRAAAQYRKYVGLAEKINTLLGRLHVEDKFVTASAVKNWHLADDGLKVGGLPTVELNKGGDKLPALKLDVTQKGACGNFGSIGFNKADMRPEIFAPTVCKTQPKLSQKPPAVGTPTAGSHRTTPPRTTGQVPPSTVPSTPSTPPTAQTSPPTQQTASTPPPSGKCECIAKTSAMQPVPTPAPNTRPVPTAAPAEQLTTPVNVTSPARVTNTNGNNGGSTSNPVVTGTPSTADTGSHTSSIPTPTGGPFG